MYKWAIYKCYCITWCEEKINQGTYKIITLTNKTCKLEQVEKPYFDYISRFFRKKNKFIHFRTKENMKDFIKEEFIKYDTWCGMPFIFNIK